MAGLAATNSSADALLQMHRALNGCPRDSRGMQLVTLLRTAVPATVSALTSRHETPLYVAASRHWPAAIQLLLAAAPRLVTVPTSSGELPLHAAADDVLSTQLLLEAAPQTAYVPDGAGRVPLKHGLRAATSTAGWLNREEAHAAVRMLMGCGPLEQPLRIVASYCPEHCSFVIDLLTVRSEPLSAAQWALIPSPCPGLGRALPARLAVSPEQARQVVRSLPPADQLRLHTAALSIHRAQHVTGIALPAPIVSRILALSSA